MLRISKLMCSVLDWEPDVCKCSVYIMVASCCPWPLYTTRGNEQQGRCMLDIRTVLNGGRANHYKRLLGTVESLLQKRITGRASTLWRISRDCWTFFQQRSSPEDLLKLLLILRFYLVMFLWEELSSQPENHCTTKFRISPAFAQEAGRRC